MERSSQRQDWDVSEQLCSANPNSSQPEPEPAPGTTAASFNAATGSTAGVSAATPAKSKPSQKSCESMTNFAYLYKINPLLKSSEALLIYLL